MAHHRLDLVLTPLQDLRQTGAMTVACINVTECVLHPESFPHKLETARKVCAHLSQTCGLSKEDLPANLLMRFNEFRATDDSAEKTPGCLGYV